MTLLQALRYFLTEAFQSAVRSWRISAMAVLTLTVSLFLCGLFLLALQNLSSTVEGWRRGLRVVVYLEDAISSSEREAIGRRLAEPPWVRSVREVSAEEATARFEAAFPGLSRLVSGGDETPFPPSLEGVLDTTRLDETVFGGWLESLEELPGVSMVDADRDWLDQLSTLLRFASAAALALGVTFLLAAALTAASILRLVAHLQREEIAIMRLVGATEFYIRGPFVVEGLLYGGVAGCVALSSLALLVVVLGGDGDPGLWSTLLFADFLGLRSSSALLAAGAVTGLGGAIVSLRRERVESVATGN